MLGKKLNRRHWNRLCPVCGMGFDNGAAWEISMELRVHCHCLGSDPRDVLRHHYLDYLMKCADEGMSFPRFDHFMEIRMGG